MADLVPRGIGGLIAATALTFAAVTMCLGAATYWVVHETIEERLDDRVEAEAGALLAAARGSGPEGVAVVVRTREARHSAGDLGYIVLDADRRRIAGSLRAATPPDGYTELLRYEHADGSAGIAQATNRPIPGGGRLIVAADRGPVAATDRIILALFAGAFVVTVVLGLVGALLFGRIVRRRLARLSDTAAAIVAGDFSRRMPVAPVPDDFDRLSVVINDMLDRIEILLNNLRRVSADVAHDIRSPLTRLRGRLDEAGRLPSTAAMETVLMAASEDVDDVLALLDGLLAISELEGSAVRRRFQPIDLAELVDAVVEGYRPVVEAAGLALIVASEPAIVMGDPALLRQSIANLLDNCVLHANGGTRVSISVELRNWDAVLVVSDDGPGVPEAELGRIFERFVRLDASRSRPGHGLGLNLVMAIMRAHMGQARAIGEGVGLSIELRFPRAAVRQPG